MFIIYFLISIMAMYLNFFLLKRLLLSEELYSHVYAIVISLVPALFHFYVLNYRELPLLNIDISDNEPMIYLSLGLGYLSALPYIVARRMYT